MEGRRRDAGRERLRAPALQRFRDRGMHPLGVQGQALVPVHAPVAAEDGGMAARSGSRTRTLFAAEGPLEKLVARMSEATSGDRSATRRDLAGGIAAPGYRFAYRGYQEFP